MESSCNRVLLCLIWYWRAGVFADAAGGASMFSHPVR